ncbi:MAG TPA: sodium:proton antiporter [Euryarchaeota archaeon]|nr:sodium:proton antiporter [Euryarchaeota archaeon]
MKKIHAVAAGIIVLAVVILSLVLTTFNLVPSTTGVRSLGKFFLENSYFGEYSAKSPEVVTSILWDYRGLDTIYETSVFFLAIISSLALYRLGNSIEVENNSETTGSGLSFIVKGVVKLVSVMIIAVSASIALHGHLTPGGGFQGGSALAVVPLLVLVAFSKFALEKLGYTKDRAMIVRSLSLVGIAIVAVIPLLFGGYIMQNQPIFPARIGGQLTSGSLILYNIFEYLAVAAGFTAVFLLLATPEKIFKKLLGVKDE